MENNSEIIPDSCVWLAYFSEADAFHGIARDFFSKDDPFVVVPEYILLEVSTILRQRKLENELVSFLDIATKDGVYLSAEGAGVKLAEKYKHSPYKKLSFTDFALLELSKTHRVLTYDRALKKAIDDY